MKRILAILLAVVLVACTFAACSGKNGGEEKKEALKVGFIFLHDENSTYDKNFLDAAKAACDELGVEAVIKTNIDESAACTDAAEQLVDQGCKLVFADSFGHEDFMIEAAKEFPEVQFCHATGTKAHTENLANYHNAFASIYEGRYLAGIAAGMKLNEMIADGKFTAEEAKMGYVGAFTYAEVISGYTSFYLGAKSVCPTVTMDVLFTNSWYDETAEKECADKLIKGGCKLISQHADSWGAPSACEAAGVPDVSYNGSTISACPNTFIVSSRIDWSPYFDYAFDCVKNGKAIDADWTGTISTGSVVLTDFNEAVAAAGTVEAVEAAKQELIAGTRHVFDCSAFTVGGQALTSYLADVDDMGDFAPETEVIADGVHLSDDILKLVFKSKPLDKILLISDALPITYSDLKTTEFVGHYISFILCKMWIMLHLRVKHKQRKNEMQELQNVHVRKQN